MSETHYGLIFKQIREQKMLPLSYFEKVGVRKSCISKFERGVSMMSFEKIYIMLEAMDVSLEDYDLFLNRFTPPFIDEFFCELEKAEIHQEKEKLQDYYQEAIENSNFLLALVVKSKITTLSREDTQRILSFLISVKYWGYFELSLLQAILNTVNLEESKKLYLIFEDKINIYKGVFKYTRKIYQIAYYFILILTLKNEQQFAEKILEKTPITDRADFDFFISNLRKLVIGFMDYRFKNVSEGINEMEEALAVFKLLGGDKVYQYFKEKMDFYISNIDEIDNNC